MPSPKCRSDHGATDTHGYPAEYEDHALAFTEAPASANALMRQRFRWSFGILQAVFEHKGVFARSRSGFRRTSQHP
jgi:cellulose synthase/poly-beta-1,6-N-acetylglucosamine synthase-like glycosyltransferase